MEIIHDYSKEKSIINKPEDTFGYPAINNSNNKLFNKQNQNTNNFGKSFFKEINPDLRPDWIKSHIKKEEGHNLLKSPLKSKSAARFYRK